MTKHLIEVINEIIFSRRTKTEKGYFTILDLTAKGYLNKTGYSEVLLPILSRYYSKKIGTEVRYHIKESEGNII